MRRAEMNARAAGRARVVLVLEERHGAVAGQRELDFTYTLTDRIFRLSIGETGDFSGAKYDGDWSLTLEQAQRRKHDFVWEQLGLPPGPRGRDPGGGGGGGWGALPGRG